MSDWRNLILDRFAPNVSALNIVAMWSLGQYGWYFQDDVFYYIPCNFGISILNCKV